MYELCNPALEYIKKHPRCTSRDIRENGNECRGKPQSIIARVLQRLLDENKVRRIPLNDKPGNPFGYEAISKPKPIAKAAAVSKVSGENLQHTVSQG